jgi:hypothetical protein
VSKAKRPKGKGGFWPEAPFQPKFRGEVREGSGNDVGGHRIFQSRDPVTKQQLSLFQSLQLQLVRRADRQQGVYGRVKIAVFLP